MHTLKLNLKERSYNIVVGSHILAFLGEELAGLQLGKDAYIITNYFIKERYGSTLSDGLKKAGINFKFKTVPDSEKAKDIKIAASLIKDLARFDLRKQPFIIALGGGVVGDLSGFVASIYKRGIPYVQVPTTLLSQVDSSIGGKTAVDLNEGKNLAGAFYQPRLVFSDISLLKTLDKKQVASGMAEVIKYGLIKDRRLFEYLESKHANILKLKQEYLKHIVKSCARIKASVVSHDEREKKGLRTILNFGHTIGHAFESISYEKNTPVLHGYAVAWGMIAELYLSHKLLGFPKNILIDAVRLIKDAYGSFFISCNDYDRLFELMTHDKKNDTKEINFTLLADIGAIRTNQNTTQKEIFEALDFYCDSVGI